MQHTERGQETGWQVSDEVRTQLSLRELVLESRVDLTAIYLRQAYQWAALHSDDPRTQNGAVLVNTQGHIVGAGVNQFPHLVEVTPDRLERPTKYSFMEHAERNCIFDALRNGYSAAGMTLFCPWFACCDCARAIIQAGIKQVVGHQQVFDKYGTGPWTESIEIGNQMFLEAGVKTELYDGAIGGVEILFNGEKWQP